MKKGYATIKVNKGLRVTDRAWDGFKTLSNCFGLSRAEFVERLGRGMITPAEFQEIYKKFLDNGLTK